eukprot:773148-Amphidinium_carterae.1
MPGRAADQFCVDCVKQMCEKHLSSLVDLENVEGQMPSRFESLPAPLGKPLHSDGWCCLGAFLHQACCMRLSVSKHISLVPSQPLHGHKTLRLYCFLNVTCPMRLHCEWFKRQQQFKSLYGEACGAHCTEHPHVRLVSCLLGM